MATYFGKPPKGPFTLPGTYITPSGPVSAGGTAPGFGGGGSSPSRGIPGPSQADLEREREIHEQIR